nr:MAG TPA: putative cytoplasmic protein [Caudoviricetes sp.]
MLKKDAAVAIMKHLVTDPDHGYSQIRRQGTSASQCEVVVDGHKFYVNRGDRDCSSAVINAFRAAGIDCGNATYTGNMRSEMTKTGNFMVMPMSYSAQPGDVYLNDVNHTAMCISAYGSAEGDLLAEFSGSEYGTIDGQSGDQTGWESHITNYYDYPWNCILKCVCEETVDGMSVDPTPSHEEQRVYSTDVNIDYALRVCNGDWLPTVHNFNNVNDDGFAGLPYCCHDQFWGKVNRGSIAYQVHQQYGDWTNWGKDGEVVGTPGKPIDGIRAYYTTPNGESYKQVWYRSQTTERAGWLDVVCDDGTTYGGDDYAGWFSEPLDRAQMAITDHNPY